MKKLILFGLVFICLISFASAFNLSDNFNRAAFGDNWTINPGGGAITLDNNERLKMVGTVTTRACFNITGNTGALSGVYNISYTVNSSQTNQRSQMAGWNSNEGSDTNKRLSSLFIDDDATFQAPSGTALSNYVAGVAYNITHEVNETGQTYRIWINGTLETGWLAFDNALATNFFCIYPWIGGTYYFDDLKIYNVSAADSTPPTNSSWNVTSGTVVSGENTAVWNTGGTINITSNLLSLTVTTNEAANGSCVLGHDWNYSYTIANNSNYKFATTDTTSHSYTVYDNISIGNHCLYCSFIDADGNEFANSSSGCLNLTFIAGVYATAISPVDNYNSAINNISFTCNSTGVVNLTNITLNIWNSTDLYYSNSVNISGTENSTTWNVTNIKDNHYNWSCYLEGSGSSYNDTTDNRTFLVDTTYPIINITSPEGAYNTQSLPLTLDLNYTITETNVDSCWYYTEDIFGENDTEDAYSCEGNFSVTYPCSNAVDEDWSTFSSALYGGTANIIENFTKPTPDSIGNWTGKYGASRVLPTWSYTHLIYCNNGSDWINFANATTNNSVSIINYTIPISSDCLTGNIFQVKNSVHEAAPGGTDYDYYEGKVIWELKYNLTNCNNITFNSTYGSHNITLYVNDTAGHLVNDTNNFQITRYYGVVYDNETYEFESETFKINITYDSAYYTGIGADLNYNGTSYGATRTGTGDNATFSRTIAIPNIAETINLSFYWQIDLTGTTDYSFNTTGYNQSVTNILMDDCTNYSNVFMNMTLYNEGNKTIIPVSSNPYIEIDLDIGDMLYNNTFNKTNNAVVCLNNVPVGQTAYSTVKYGSVGTVVEYYYLDNHIITNETLNVSLYDLDSADSTTFLITFYGSNFLPVSDAIIDIWRYYVGEGQYISVEMAKTSEDGETRGHFVSEDIHYKFYVRKDGELLYTSPESIVMCKATPCQIDLYQKRTPESPVDFGTTPNLAYTLTPDEDNRKVELEYASLDGSPILMNLFVETLGSVNTTVCNESQTSAGGTLTCTIPYTYSNYSYYIEVKKDNEFVDWTTISLQLKADEIFGGTGIILTMSLYITLAMMGMASGIAVIAFGLLGIILATMLNLFAGGSILSTGSTLLWAIIAGVILIIKISQRRVR